VLAIGCSSAVAIGILQEYLEDNDEVAFETFRDKIWDNIREIYRRLDTEAKEIETDPVTTETPDVSLCTEYVTFNWFLSESCIAGSVRSHLCIINNV